MNFDTENKKFIIGIDLGTTNSAVAYIDQSDDSLKSKKIKLFRIPQLTASGEVTQLQVLPSFCYIPGKFDISKEAFKLPWKTDEQNFVGAFARDYGAKIPSHLVSSAKSWLCHNGVDRKARILPWGSGAEIGKISPVQTTASYLKHICMAWNSMRGDVDELYLENQMIIITVPASFDEVARDLTLEAAAIAGLTNVTLLEEPLAAFYSWLITNENDWHNHIKPGELIFVCDVGGGTTDFTLIALQETDGSPRFQRIAVGDHLILGGDNIDLAIARYIEKKFHQTSLLRSDQLKVLCHLCRKAKENILNNLSDQERITMVGEGSSLISGTLNAIISRSELETIILDGFFPLVKNLDDSKTTPRKGISEFGLPYETEPAITRHIGNFLEKHRFDVMKSLIKDPYPDIVLFNGGSLKAKIVQERIREAIRFWFSEKESNHPKILNNPNPDLAVALGAAYYGLVKSGKGVRVGSGSARAYYIGFGRKDDANRKDAMCLIERGLEEGVRVKMSDHQFEVLANQPVSFDIYSSSFRSGDKCGDMILLDDTLTLLPPLQTVIQFGQKGVKASIPVEIEAEYTELGVLALWCQSLSTPHQWRMEFQIRELSAEPEVSNMEIFESSSVNEAILKIQTAFSKASNATLLSRLVKSISVSVNRPKEKWPLSFIRRLADELLTFADARQYSSDHEIRWLSLTGYCLRPGFGDGADEQRMKMLWKIYQSGVCFKNNIQSMSEWWIIWRRLAGGLSSGQQRQIIQDIRSQVISKKGIKIKIHPQEHIEVWMAVGNMERLSVKDKIELGRTLLFELQPKKIRPQLIWTISRIGARSLLYGPIDRVVPPQEVEKWIRFLMEIDWKNIKFIGAAIAQVARKTGDRARDIDQNLCDEIIQWLRKNKLDDEIHFINTIAPMAKKEENIIFGENVPSGIFLKER